MLKKILTDEQDLYLRNIAPGKSVQDCTDMLNDHFKSSFTLSQIRSYKSNHSIVSGKKPWEFIDCSKMSIMSKNQDKWLRNNVKGRGNEEITRMFNEEFETAFTVKQIKGYKRNHNISSELTGYFHKGHTPINKGTKGMFNLGGNKTSFKAGSKPLNTDPIGTEKMLSDGYVWTKINDIPKAKKGVNWDQKHRIVYEQNFGPIPVDHVVIFADGDKANFDPCNLVLVSKSELLIMNKKKLINTNSDITKTGAIVAKLIDKTHKVKNKQNDE